jgi:hypothetical protein
MPASTKTARKSTKSTGSARRGGRPPPPPPPAPPAPPPPPPTACHDRRAEVAHVRLAHDAAGLNGLAFDCHASS